MSLPVALLAASSLVASFAAPPAGDVLATVDGAPITGADVDLFLALRGASGPASPAFRERALGELIDRELVRRFLKETKAEPDADQLAAAVQAAKLRIASSGRDPDEILRRLGVDEARLRAELAVPLAWRKHVRRVVTDGQIAERFDAHRRRFDGTKLRVSQIFLKYEPGETAADAPRTTARLEAIRDEIAAGRTTFADAARTHSQTPTAADGGDVGWIAPTGDLPRPVARAAFGLDPGGLSGVVLSPFGAHLVTVTEVKPGDGSLEDARPAVTDEIAAELWRSTVAAARKDAKITRSGE